MLSNSILDLTALITLIGDIEDIIKFLIVLKLNYRFTFF